MKSVDHLLEEQSLPRETVNFDQEQQISALIDGLYEALSRHDSRAVIEAFADRNVMFTLAPPLQNVSGTSPGEEGVKEWLASFSQGPDFQLRDRVVYCNDNLAATHFLARMVGKKVDGEKVDMWYRETHVLKLIDDQWQIVHEHQSVPFYMDKEAKAARDLKPETVSSLQ